MTSNVCGMHWRQNCAHCEFCKYPPIDHVCLHKEGKMPPPLPIKIERMDSSADLRYTGVMSIKRAIRELRHWRAMSTIRAEYRRNR